MINHHSSCESAVKVSAKFDRVSDKLKTEVALLKMDGSYRNSLEIIPHFEIPRYNDPEKMLNCEFPMWIDLAPQAEEQDVIELAEELLQEGNINDGVHHSCFNDASLVQYEWAVVVCCPSADPYHPEFNGESAFCIDDEDRQIIIVSNPNGWVYNGNYQEACIEAREQTDQGQLLYTGDFYINNTNELGKSIGDTDITQIRYFTKPLQLVEMFGEFQTPLQGCTDELACNWNAAANIDDGTCLYEDCFKQ